MFQRCVETTFEPWICLRHSGNMALASPCKAASQSRFRPAVKDDVKVEIREFRDPNF